ncbi:hypothetical protein [Leifsonia poae]|uniref:hypothetical protein n=1 Tax=Leifsonia poae TaxID=110933 RepID=UPI001CBFEE1C|nr:hypothetical protein [Leifsonia poae]
MTQPGLFTIDSDEAREAAAQLQRAGTEANAAIIDATRGTMSQAFGEELAASGGTTLQHQIIATGAESYGSGFGITMRAATTATLSGGLVASDGPGRAFEFGKSVERTRTYLTHSRKGTPYSITRVTTRQLPTRSRSGWVAYPAAGRTFDRLVQMYLQILVKKAHDAIERSL